MSKQHISATNPFQTLWKYEVFEYFRDDFISAYSDTGEWSELFAKCPGYLGTKLIVDVQNMAEFITIDYWATEADFKNMMSLIDNDYRALDKKCGKFTKSETHIGYFRAVE